MREGRIALLKGSFGFVAEDGTGRRYYFNGSGLQRMGPRFHELSEGMRVRFTGIEHPKGLRAIEVRVLGGGQHGG